MGDRGREEDRRRVENESNEEEIDSEKRDRMGRERRGDRYFLLFEFCFLHLIPVCLSVCLSFSW